MPSSPQDKLDRLNQLRQEALAGGGAEKIAKLHEKGRLSARERIHLLLDEGSFQETGVFVRHRSHEMGMDANRPVGDGMVTGVGRIDGRQVYVFAQDFTVFGGSMSEANARQDLPADGPGPGERLSGDRAERQRRRAHPGGRPLAGRLRRDLLAQHDGLRRDPPDLGHPRPLRRGRGLLARDHRLHHHDRPDQLHVRHRPERHQDGHERGGLVRGAGRRDHALDAQRRGPSPGGERSRLPADDAPPAELPAPEQPRGPAAHRAERPAGPARGEAQFDRSGGQPEAVRHARRDPAGGGRGRFHGDPAAARDEPDLRFRAAGWPARRHRREPAQGAGRRPGHRLEHQGCALRAHLRLLQRAAGRLRGRARIPARHRPGIRRDHQARRQAAVRLLRGHRPEADRDHAQGLRRRLRRHEQQAHPGRLERGLALGRAGGHGLRRRGEHPVPQPDRLRARIPMPSGRA